MKKATIKATSRRVLYGVMAMAMTLAYFPMLASAAQVTNRKVVIGNSAPSANTTYVFTFTVPNLATPIKSVSISACTTASGACTPASNPNFSGATLASQPTNLGAATGWTLANTTSVFKLLNGTNSTNPSGSQTISFTNAVNPDSPNATFFLRIATFSDVNWTTGIDAGVMAASTAGIVTVNAVIDETLTFTLGSSTVDLGTITPAAYGKGSSTMTVGTNATTGYSLSYTGNTLTTTGGKVIDAMASKAALGSLGSAKQFGINLALNTTPGIGAAVSGAGSGAATTNYITPNSYMFNTAGDVVATAAAATNNNVFTSSYVSNITTDTAAGAYTTAINYVATANF